MPLPPERIIEHNGVESRNANIVPYRGNSDPYFSFAIYKKETWTGTLIDYKNSLYKKYEICREMTWSEHDGIGVISFIGTCGVTCEEQRILYQGVMYSLKDGCDLSGSGRALKAAAIFNVRAAMTGSGSLPLPDPF